MAEFYNPELLLLQVVTLFVNDAFFLAAYTADDVRIPLVVIKYINTKSALNRSGIVKDGLCLNPYGGCAHGCLYCYAVFMKRHYGTDVPWGDFVIVKRNVLEALDRELKRKRPTKVWIASVTDAWQPVESELLLTRGCMERLLSAGFGLSLLTKSALILRDMELIAENRDRVETGISVTTDDAKTAGILEPGAPSPERRMETLARLSDAGIRTYAFVGPVLPMNPAGLARKLKTSTGRVLIDGMNYRHRVQDVYRSRGWTRFLLAGYFREVAEAFRAEFGSENVETCW